MRVINYTLLSVLIALCLGCSNGFEFTKRSLGVSTVDFEAEKGRGVIKTIDEGFDSCYFAVKDAIASMGASIFVQKNQNHLLVAGGFEKIVEYMDTSRVAVFFDEVAFNKTKIEVVSLNKSLQIKVADELFPFVERRLNIESSSLNP